jgi:predicted DNA-binding ribbon-helix-helix protein
MAHSRYYSPRLERPLISALYHAAKARRIPMTRLASSLVREGRATRNIPSSLPTARAPGSMPALRFRADGLSALRGAVPFRSTRPSQRIC